MATEVLGFTARDDREEQFRKWTQERSRGLSRFTTHQGNDPLIIWCVSRTEPIETKEGKNGTSAKGADTIHENNHGLSESQDYIQEGRESVEGHPYSADCSEFRDWSA